jgi:hypothetical protein
MPREDRRSAMHVNTVILTQDEGAWRVVKEFKDLTITKHLHISSRRGTFVVG